MFSRYLGKPPKKSPNRPFLESVSPIMSSTIRIFREPFGQTVRHGPMCTFANSTYMKCKKMCKHPNITLVWYLKFIMNVRYSIHGWLYRDICTLQTYHVYTSKAVWIYWKTQSICLHLHLNFKKWNLNTYIYTISSANKSWKQRNQQTYSIMKL